MQVGLPSGFFVPGFPTKIFWYMECYKCCFSSRAKNQMLRAVRREVLACLIWSYVRSCTCNLIAKLIVILSSCLFLWALVWISCRWGYPNFILSYFTVTFSDFFWVWQHSRLCEQTFIFHAVNSDVRYVIGLDSKQFIPFVSPVFLSNTVHPYRVPKTKLIFSIACILQLCIF